MAYNSKMSPMLWLKWAMTAPPYSPELAVVWDYAVEYGLTKANEGPLPRGRILDPNAKLVYIPTETLAENVNVRFVFEAVDLAMDIQTDFANQIASALMKSEGRDAYEERRRRRLINRDLLSPAVVSSLLR
jgi:hypothetical protein